MRLTPERRTALLADPSPPPSSPRNRQAFALGRRRREVIRGLMLAHAQRHPLARSLSAKQMLSTLRDLGVYLSPSTIAWHMAAIREEASREAFPAESE